LELFLFLPRNPFETTAQDSFWTSKEDFVLLGESRIAKQFGISVRARLTEDQGLFSRERREKDLAETLPA
jgi:hypothetical protein